MKIEKLLEMDLGEAISWLENNQEYYLIKESELEEIVEARDFWEEKATELANGVGSLAGGFIGEHSSANCPIQNALDMISEQET